MSKITPQALLKATGATSQRELARKLGVTQNCVWRWFRVGWVSPGGAIAIEKLTKGQIAATDMRTFNDRQRRRRAHSGARKKTRPAVSEAAGA